MPAKPFLTIGQQAGLLRDGGVAVTESTGRLPPREGCYSIVNGYKRHCIGEGASRSADDARVSLEEIAKFRTSAPTTSASTAPGLGAGRPSTTRRRRGCSSAI